jgi:PAS domain S-box-containing protein
MTSIFQGHDQGVRPHGTPSSGMPTPGGATAALDQHLRFTGWSREAEELFGLASEEVLGRSADAVLADTETGAGISSAAGDGGTAWSLGPRPVRRGDGRPVPGSLSLTPLALGVGATGWLLVAVDSEPAHWEALGRAMLDGLDRESPVQLVIYDTDARVRWINAARSSSESRSRRSPEGPEGHSAAGRGAGGG